MIGVIALAFPVDVLEGYERGQVGLSPGGSALNALDPSDSWLALGFFHVQKVPKHAPSPNSNLYQDNLSHI